MATLSKKELTDILGQIFDFLKEKNLLPPGIKNKDEYINDIANKLEGLTTDDVSKEEVQKSLVLSIMDPKLIKVLFKDLENVAPDNRIQVLASDLREFLNELTPENKLTPAKMQLLAEQLAEKLDNARQNDQLAKEENVPGIFAEMLMRSMTLRKLYGGVDPEHEGELSYPLTGPEVSNVLGLPYAGPIRGGISDSVMEESVRYDPGKPDCEGLEALAFDHLVEAGIMPLVKPILDDAIRERLHLKPHIPGMPPSSG